MFVKLAGANAGTSAFLRCAIALLVLVPLAAYELRRRGPLDARLVWCGIAAGVFLGLDYLMWTVSIFDVGAAIATVLVNVQVIAFPVLARLCGGVRLSRRFLLVSPVMLAGVALASGAFGGASGVSHPVRGAVLGVAAGVAYAAFLYLNRHSGERSPGHTVTPVCLATAAAGGTAALIGPFTTGIDLTLPAAAWGWLTALALIGQALAWLLISVGARRLPPHATGGLLLLQPVLAVGFGVLVLREDPTPPQLLGCAVVIVSVWLANRAPRARAELEAELETGGGDSCGSCGENHVPHPGERGIG
jgi:drug/metabolite transporter (DMT)-like permease